MNTIKKLVAVLLIAVIGVSFCGCHKPGEAAVKVGDVTFTSGYYMCAVLEADQEARSKVNSALQEEGKDTENEEINYSKQKVDGKAYDKWVKDTAIDTLKKIAAFELKCKEADLKPDEKAVSELNRFINDFWDGGFSTLYEVNGVGKDTFIKFCTEYSSSVFNSTYYQMMMSAYQNGGTMPDYAIDSTDYETLYFNHLYDKDGVKEVSDKELNEKILKENILVGKLSVPLTSQDESGNTTNLSDAEVAKLVKQVQGYEKAIKSGKKNFDEVMHDYEGAKEEEKEEKAKDGPLTEHATVIDENDANYETASKMKNGEVTVIGLNKGKVEEGATELVLLVRLNLKKDFYYVDKTREDQHTSLLHELKDEEFNTEIDTYIGTLKFEEVKSVTKQFKINKIEYPEQ